MKEILYAIGESFEFAAAVTGPFVLGGLIGGTIAHGSYGLWYPPLWLVGGVLVLTLGLAAIYFYEEFYEELIQN